MVHSEHNMDSKSPLRFIQMWIKPRKSGLKPAYGSAIGDASSRQNQWAHLVSDVNSAIETPVKINQDANIYVAEVSGDNTISFELMPGRQAYLLGIENTTEISGGYDTVSLEAHDAAELSGPMTLKVHPKDPNRAVHLLIVEMEKVGSGREDL